jgi:hypothetical protein
LIESNIFPILNLSELNCKYRFYRVRNLPTSSEDFEKNARILVEILSKHSHSPCEFLRDGSDCYIVKPLERNLLPGRIPLVGTEVLIEETEVLKTLEYGALTQAQLPLAIRFLQFYINHHLFENLELWQPRSGQAFFQKIPDREFEGADRVDAYKGFQVRPIVLPKNQIGICVDISHKYVSRSTLPHHLHLDEFVRRFKGRRCLYEYGNRWYEFKLEELSDLDVSHLRFEGQTLYDHVHSVSRNSKSPNLLRMPTDCSVVAYSTNLGLRHAPSGLCRLTFKTDHPILSNYHSLSMMPPYLRRRQIATVVTRYLAGLLFGSTRIRLDTKTIGPEVSQLLPPGLEFGGGRVVNFTRDYPSYLEQTRTIPKMIESRMWDIGKIKRTILQTPDSGFFVKKSLDRQFLIIPRSIDSTIGDRFIEDLSTCYRSMYFGKETGDYAPTKIVYDDSVRKSIYSLGNEINQAGCVKHFF